MGDANPIRTLRDYSMTAKLRNNILMFQQHQGESLSEAWTRFKDLLQKVHHHGIDRWLQIQIFYDHVSFHLKCEIDPAADGKLHNKSTDESWEIIENLTLYDNEKEINDRIAEMFGLLKELTTSRAPKKVLIREEAKSAVTKNVNSISLAKGEEERSDNDDMAADSGINGTYTEMPLKEAEKETEVENGTKNK
ncbi:hypothetical protein Tco_0484713 [Tanacetum coccineum]